MSINYQHSCPGLTSHIQNLQVQQSQYHPYESIHSIVDLLAAEPSSLTNKYSQIDHKVSCQFCSFDLPLSGATSKDSAVLSLRITT